MRSRSLGYNCTHWKSIIIRLRCTPLYTWTAVNLICDRRGTIFAYWGHLGSLKIHSILIPPLHHNSLFSIANLTHDFLKQCLNQFISSAIFSFSPPLDRIDSDGAEEINFGEDIGMEVIIVLIFSRARSTRERGSEGTADISVNRNRCKRASPISLRIDVSIPFSFPTLPTCSSGPIASNNNSMQYHARLGGSSGASPAFNVFAPAHRTSAAKAIRSWCVLSRPSAEFCQIKRITVSIYTCSSTGECWRFVKRSRES